MELMSEELLKDAFTKEKKGKDKLMTGPIGISVGSDQDAVICAGEAILAILQEPRDELTIQKALDVFESRCTVKDVAISHCNIQMGIEDFELEDD